VGAVYDRAFFVELNEERAVTDRAYSFIAQISKARFASRPANVVS
jgi:hypothetical protein